MKFNESYKHFLDTYKKIEITPDIKCGSMRIISGDSPFDIPLTHKHVITFKLLSSDIYFDMVNEITVTGVDVYESRKKYMHDNNIEFIDRLSKIEILYGDIVVAEDYPSIFSPNDFTSKLLIPLVDGINMWSIRLTITVNVLLPIEYCLKYSPWLRTDRWKIMVCGGNVHDRDVFLKDLALKENEEHDDECTCDCCDNEF